MDDRRQRFILDGEGAERQFGWKIGDAAAG
jgi:hypothetical protein